MGAGLTPSPNTTHFGEISGSSERFKRLLGEKYFWHETYFNQKPSLATSQSDYGLVTTKINGGSAGNHTVTGVATSDTLAGVLHFTPHDTAQEFADLSSEFSITAANTINNTGGTDTTGDDLLVYYFDNSADAARNANKDWIILGENASNDDVTLRSGGGITAQTDGSDEDQVIITPNTTSGQSALYGINWSTELHPYLSVDIETAADIDDMVIWAGFRSTDSDSEATAAAIIADADDQFMLLYGDTGTTYTTSWQAVSSRSGTDTQTNSLQISSKSTSAVTVEASSLYRLELWLDRDRVPHYYINGVKVATADSTALDASTTTLDPYIGIMEEGSGAARSFHIRRVAVSQLIT